MRERGGEQGARPCGVGWQVGRRLTRMTILTGSIARAWGTPEPVLER